MKKILQWLSGSFFNDVKGVLDEVITTKEEKELIKLKLMELILTHTNKSDELRAGIIEVEAKGNWLQRSWRPILMLAFGSVVLFHYFLYPTIRAFSPELPDLAPLVPDFWNLLSIGIGGYVVGRSIEKIVPNLKINSK